MPIILKKHPSLVHHKKIKALCSPLDKLNINYFSCSHINNNAEFFEHYIKKEYFNADLHTANTSHFGKYVIWDAIPRAGKTSEMGEDAKAFGIEHTFTIIKKHNDGESFYHFATSIKDESMNQVFLANVDLLESMYHQLKTKINTQSSGYIIKPENNLIVSSRNREDFVADLNHGQAESECFDIFQSIHSNLLSFQYELIKKTNQALSQREAQCLYYTLQGKSARATGSKLHISQRTVEYYINLLKDKFYCESKSDLIEKIMKLINSNDNDCTKI
jgi:DNA-binding CsgD family transcriptional regulator